MLEAYYPMLVYILLSHIAIPLVLICLIAFRKNKSMFDLCTKSMLTLLYIVYILINGYWDLFLHIQSKAVQWVYAMRFAIPILFLFVLTIKIYRARRIPFYVPKSVLGQAFRGLSVLTALLLIFINISYCKIMFPLIINEPDSFAFVNVNVITMENENVLENQTVFVREGKIYEMGPAEKIKLPQDIKTIDGQNKFLIPGLIDLHTHLLRKEDITLFISQGVTTVRNMNGREWHLRMRQYIKDGKFPGPRIYTSGPIVDGANGQTYLKLTKPEDADYLVKQQKYAGFDYIKAYDGLSREVFNALGDASKKYGIRLVGHVPGSADIYSLALNKLYSIEHCVWNNLTDPYILKEAGIWYCPTIVAFAQRNSKEEVEKLLKQDFMKYVPPSSMQDWEKDFKLYGYDLGDTVRSQNGRNQLYSLHKAGVRVITGTDSSIALLAPGYSLHQELKELVLAGLTPYEALKASTRDSAEFLGDLENSGTIKKGKRADLVLLNSNPLNTISNTSDQSGVAVNGKWYTSEEFKEILDGMSRFYIAEEFVRDLYNRIMGK